MLTTPNLLSISRQLFVWRPCLYDAVRVRHLGYTFKVQNNLQPKNCWKEKLFELVIAHYHHFKIILYFINWQLGVYCLCLVMFNKNTIWYEMQVLSKQLKWLFFFFYLKYRSKGFRLVLCFVKELCCNSLDCDTCGKKIFTLILIVYMCDIQKLHYSENNCKRKIKSRACVRAVGNLCKFCCGVCHACLFSPVDWSGFLDECECC